MQNIICRGLTWKVEPKENMTALEKIDKRLTVYATEYLPLVIAEQSKARESMETFKEQGFMFVYWPLPTFNRWLYKNGYINLIEKPI